MIKIALPFIAISSFLFCTGCADQFSTSRYSRDQGVQLLASRDYAHAVGAFRNAVKQEPRDYKSHFYLGVCYEELHQYQLAIESYKTALAVPDGQDEEGSPKLFRPQMVDALAKAIATYDDRDTELDALEATAKTKPSKAADTYMLLAKIYRYRKDADSAMHSYQQALIQSPQDFDIFKEYGLYLLDNLQQTKEAEVPLRRAYALNPNDDQVNAALRRMSIIPGPGLREQADLARPLMPKGPLPEVDITKIDVTKMFNRNAQPTPQPQPQPVVVPTPAPSPSVAAPRD